MSVINRMACAAHGHTFCAEYHSDQEMCLVCHSVSYGDDLWAGKLAVEAGMYRPVRFVTSDKCPICCGDIPPPRRGILHEEPERQP